MACAVSNMRSIVRFFLECWQLVLHKFALLFIAACALFAPVSSAKIERSQAVRNAFVKAQACPATGKHRLPCQGYVIDHIKALACGGADAPENMQWQTREEAKAKDRWELKECGK